MELRRCSQFHYIRTIKAGSIQITSNVDARGRPSLMFKTLQDICENEDSKRFGSISSLLSQVMLEDTSNGCNRVDRTCLHEEEKERDISTSDADCNPYRNEADSDSDDLDFESVTLKQLKKRCKTKKRKVLHSPCLTPKQECTDWMPEDDEVNLDEYISSLMAKKRTKKRSSISPSPVKSEPIVFKEDSSGTGSFLPAPFISKIHTLDTGDSLLKNTSFSSEDSSVCSELMAVCKESSDKLPSAESEQETTGQVFLSEQKICALNEASYVNLELTESTCNSHLSVGENVADILEETRQHSQAVPAPTSSEIETLDARISELKHTNFSAEDSSVVCTEEMELGKEVTGDILLPAASQPTYVEAFYDDLEHMESTCNIRSNGGEDILKESPGHSQAPPAPVTPEMETLETEDLKFKITSFSAEDSSLVCTEVMELCKDKSNDISPSPVKGQRGHINDISDIQGPDIVLDNNLGFTDIRNTDASCKFEGISNGNLPPNSEHNSQSSPSCNNGPGDYCSLWSPDPYLSPEINFSSRESDDFATEKSSIMFTDVPENIVDPDISPVEKSGTPKNPQGYACDSAEMDFTDGNQVCGVANEMAVLEMDKHLEHSHPPERLLSTRKAISPTSQEKLRQAMKSVELTQDGVLYLCKEKLQFGEDTGSKAASAEHPGSDTETARVNAPSKGLEEIGRTNITMNPKQMIRIPKNGRKGSPTKGTRKVPNHSGSLPPSSIRSCSESAIAFSRRQMQDMESLAAKLMQELKSMKDIVEGNLQSESSPTTLLKCDEDEVKLAIKSATKAEETTRKWLSIMSRDCNRFCKLMSSNGKSAKPTGNTIVRKERRKITFADEAGGTLCHVKVFEDDNTPSLESANEQIV